MENTKRYVDADGLRTLIDRIGAMRLSLTNSNGDLMTAVKALGDRLTKVEEELKNITARLDAMANKPIA